MIKVVTKLGSSATEHKNGARLNIVDGNLFIFNEDNKTVAVYADGQWLSAVKS